MDDERRFTTKLQELGEAALAAELERYREVVAVQKEITRPELLRLWHLNLPDDGTEAQKE